MRTRTRLRQMPPEIIRFTAARRFIRRNWRNFQLTAGHRCERYLEIGTWRGSSLFSVFQHLRPKVAYAIDPYPDDFLNGRRIGREHLASGDQWTEVDDVPGRVRELWAKYYPAVRGELICESSRNVLPRLLADTHSRFDLVYIDGSHQGPDVLFDAVNASMLVRPGGFLIFDDYRLARLRDRASLRLAVDTFQRLNHHAFEVISENWQLVLKRRYHDRPITNAVRASRLPATERYALPR